MGVQILIGDVREKLKELPDESVHCVVTSPPYFGLRDYGVDGQIGLEPTPAEFVAVMVEVFREVRRVLRKDGTLWLNLGDSYANDGKWGGHTGGKHVKALHCSPIGRNKRYTGLKPKDRVMIPARVAIALQDDGWWLRDEIVWQKPNPMPSSVKDRTTPAHEMVYLLTRSARYHYDAEAIMEPMSDVSIARLSQPSIVSQQGGDKQDAYEAAGLNERSGSRRPNEIVKSLAAKVGKNERIDGPSASTSPRAGFNARWDAQEAHQRLNNQDEKLVAGEKWGARHEGWKATAADRVGRNKRSVWTIATEPFPEAHFATFPTALIEPCILAGCPKDGTVLDPFFGAGTTGLVADRLGRNCIGIELNEQYAEIARRRIRGDAPLFAEVS